MILVQAGRMNISLDFDTLWYGVRSEYVLDNGTGIYENPGMVGMAYVYAKGLETLALPLSDLASHSYLLALNLWIAAAGLMGIYRLAGLFMNRTWALAAAALSSCIPGIMNMAISAKPDVITWVIQIFMVYYMACYIKNRKFALLALSGGAYLLSLTMKSTALVFSTAVFGMSGLYLLGRRLLSLRAPLRQWLLLAAPAGALTGIWARTMMITGMPVTSVFTSIFAVLGAAYAIIIYIFMSPILDLLGTSSNTRDFAQSYLFFILLGAPLVMVNTCMGQVIRSEGAATQSMVGNMIGTIVNIILDPIFILFFGLGVPGAAIATVIGNACSTVFFVYYLLKKSQKMSILPKDFSFQRQLVFAILSIGLPSGISTLLNSISSIFENNLLVGHGDQYVAAFSVAGKATMIIGMLQMGIALGVQPIIAYSYGAKKWDRMNETIRKTAGFTLVLGLLLTIVCRIFSHQLVAAFLDDAEIIPLGIYVISISTLTGPLTGVYQLCTTFLQSTEKAGYAIFVSVLRQGLVFIPALYIMNRLFGFNGIVWCQPAAMVISLILAFFLAMRHYRQLRKKDDEDNNAPSGLTAKQATAKEKTA